MAEHHGKIWWSELMTRDVAAAKAYYGKVCGWTWQEMPMMEEGIYHLGMKDGAPIVGVMDMTGHASMAEVPPHWFTYIAVDDVDAAVAETTALGGTVIRQPFDIPDTGRIAIVTDPAGAPIGLMTPEPMPQG